MTTMYKLEERSIKSIPGTDKEVRFDLEGLLGFPNNNWNPATGKGKIVLRFRYSVNGQRRKFKLGSYPQNTIKQLSAAYKGAAGDVAQGRDPQGQRKQEQREVEQERVKESEIITVAQIGQDFVDWSKENKKSWQEDQRIYKTEILTSPIAHCPVTELKYEDVAELLIKITNRPATYMANRVKSWITKCLRMAKQQNPRKLKHLNVASIIFDLPKNKEKERNRVLSESELLKFWLAIDEVQNENHRRALRFLVMTGQRRSEIITLHSNHIENGWWTNPETKNGIAHRIPLSVMAMEQVDVEGWVFPGRDVDHINVNTFGHLVPEVAALAGIERCTAHDLRRTVGTFVQSRFGSEVMHRVLNHVEDKLTRTYGLYQFDAEKKKALLTWEQEVKRIIGLPVDNVIQLSA